MREPMNIQEVLKLQPDFMGFIFYRSSPRFVDELILPEPWPASVKRVGVFVNASNEEMILIGQKYHFDYLQLHGGETPEQIHELRQQPFGIIKAFGLDNKFDFSSLEAYAGLVDLFLFDTKSPLYGGTGQVFDWSLLTLYKGNTPYLLSGGVGPQVLKDLAVLNDPRCIGIDLNSKVEVAPGLKNPAAIEAIMNEIPKLTI